MAANRLIEKLPEIAAIYTAGSAGKCRDSSAGQRVYINDFENPEDPLLEWSNPATDITPEGGRRFLGQFGSDTVELTLTDLPPHTSVTVSFDLYIIQSWDGNDFDGDPDIWDMSVADGPTLLHTTFDNQPEDPEHRQAYPDAFPGGDHPAQTGAAEINTLGYTFFGDSVYQLSFTFSHSSSSLILDFSGIRDSKIIMYPTRCQEDGYRQTISLSPASAESDFQACSWPFA
jgi:hypothetical protein